MRVEAVNLVFKTRNHFYKKDPDERQQWRERGKQGGRKKPDAIAAKNRDSYNK
jgi:hypothetical protein